MNKGCLDMSYRELAQLARSMDFDVYGFAVIDGREYVQKKTQDGDFIWWPLETEGSGFTRLFKGFSKQKNNIEPHADLHFRINDFLTNEQKQT